MPFSTILRNIRQRFSIAHSIFGAIIILFIAGSLFLVWRINKEFLITVPDYGGSFTEGIVGSPRFINPVLAFSNADKDLTLLTYSGLMKAGTKGLTPDLAETVTVSEDGLVYTFTLKDDIYFHDGVPVTVKDIAFTIERVQDPLNRSPRQASWTGVGVTIVDEKTIELRLTEPFAPFLENTTLGILPSHIWKNVSPSQFGSSLYNIEPIGSGPYTIDKIIRNSSGLASRYRLTSFHEYALGRPYIDEMTVALFDSEQELHAAYERGLIDTFYEISPQQISEILRKESVITKAPLPRTFGVFFNSDVAPLFLNDQVRQALTLAVNREAIINNVFYGYATATDSPIPEALTDETSPGRYAPEEAAALLEKNGWARDENGIWEHDGQSLEFSIATSNAPELVDVIDHVQSDWQKFGAQIEISVLAVSDLNQNVIRPREYDALLFGTSTGRQGDLFSFWHSSGRSDPGLNIALYTNIETDAILEDLRHTIPTDERQSLYRSFEDIIASEVPATLLYNPDFIYISGKNIMHNDLGILNTASERFSDIYTWHIETDHVWNIFSQQK